MSQENLSFAVAMTVAAVLGALVAAPAAEAQDDEQRSSNRPYSDFVDTRLTITFGDDDLLSATGEQVPISPLPGFGDRDTYELFFDNLNSRFSSRENLTHLVLYRELPAFMDDVTTEAAMVLRFNLETGDFADTGSYLRVRYNPWIEAPDDGVSLTLFPFDADRFRLGYLYNLSFGGADFVPRSSLLRSPGLKLQFDRDVGYYYFGFKTIPARVPLEVAIDTEGSDTDVEVVRVDETQYALLAGAGWDLFDRLAIEFGGGYFQQGRLDLPGYPRAPVYSLGGALRLAWHHNMSVGQSIDLKLYRNDPNSPFQAFRPAEYVPGEFAYMLSVEGNAVFQHLANIDVSNNTVMEPAFAGAAQFRMRYDDFRFELTGLFRDLSYILKNVPSFVPFLSIPEAATVDPEFFLAFSADYHFPSPRLTLGISGGLQFPATFGAETSTGIADANRTLVIREEGEVSILPPGLSAVPIVGARLSARWDLSEMLYTMAWVQYVHDENATRLVVSPTEGTRRTFQRADQLGFGLSAAARF